MRETKFFCDECGKEIEGDFLETLGKDFCNQNCVDKYTEKLED